MDAGFKDGYGQYLDRKQACYNQQNSLTLRVTDACPCHYPGNAYSNSRWWAPYTLYPTPETSTPTAAGGAPYTLYPTPAPNTLHPIPYTPDRIPCTPYTIYRQPLVGPHPILCFGV